MSLVIASFYYANVSLLRNATLKKVTKHFFAFLLLLNLATPVTAARSHEVCYTHATWAQEMTFNIEFLNDISFGRAATRLNLMALDLMMSITVTFEMSNFRVIIKYKHTFQQLYSAFMKSEM